MNKLILLTVPAFLLSMVGCAAPTAEGGEEEATDSAEEDVIGVTDLTAMEASLGLTKDRKDAQGRWSRGDARLKGGGCYKQTVAKGAGWEFRRYANGAAFFRKLGTAPETSDFRPVTCVDIDVKQDGRTTTNSLSGLVLDSALRYKLGKGWQDDGAAGHTYLAFDNGAIEVADAARYCGLRFSSDEPANEPALLTAQNTMASCIEAGGAEDACWSKGIASCEKAAKADIKLNPLARPANDGAYVYGLDVRGTNGSFAHVEPQIAELAYRYAWKQAQKKDVFTEPGDAVGTFARLDQTQTPPVLVPGGGILPPTAVEHARYSKLDIHRVIAPQPGFAVLEQLYVTPKRSDADPASRALAQCFRVVIPNTPAADFVCSGL